MRRSIIRRSKRRPTEDQVIRSIKAARLKQGLKSGYIAWKVGVSKASYSKIETGRLGLTLGRLLAIMATLDMTWEEAAQEEGEETAPETTQETAREAGQGDVEPDKNS